MVIGNAVLLVMNIPLLPVFVRIAQIPPSIMATITVAILIVGAYSINGNPFDVWVMVAAGIIGFGLRKLGIPPAPIVLAFILGRLFEQNFRRSLLLSDGQLDVFVSSPVGIALLLFLVLVLATAAFPQIRRARKQIENEAD